MTFARFCNYLSKIEATSKRLEMTDLVARLIKESSLEEVDRVLYLSLGQMAPLYADIDFGVADKMMIRAIALAFDIPKSSVRSTYKRHGDLGEATQELREKHGKKQGSKKEYHVNTLFDLFLKIAYETGEGSQERKLNLVAELLRSLTPIEAKYAVRILLKTLRLGFSDKTVLDALSVIITGDKSAREELETAYNVRPDVGWMAKQATSYKLQATSKKFSIEAKPQLGTPILPALCQRLPSTEEIVKKMCRSPRPGVGNRTSSTEGSGGTVAVEPKWDGQRIQAHVRLNAKDKGQRTKDKGNTVEIHLFTRSLEDVTEMFPDLVSALSSLNAKRYPLSAIFDGEIVGIDPKTGKIISFQTMMTRKRKYRVQEQLLSVPIRYMVFDILLLNGKSLMNESFEKRRSILEELFSFQKTLKTQKTGTSDTLNIRPSEMSGSPSIPTAPATPERSDGGRGVLKLAPQLVTDDPDKIRSYLKQQLDAGLEGVVTKKLDAPYSPGRTGFTWVKLKWEGDAKSGGLLDTIDCVVMGTYAGRGKRSGFGVGAFLVGVRHASRYVTVSKIGTGLSDEQWRELRAKSEKRKAKSQPKEYDVPKQLVPDVWLQPELVVEIQADNITKSPLHTAGYALRFPRLVRYRTDKKPADATTVEEVKRLYKINCKNKKNKEVS